MLLEIRGLDLPGRRWHVDGEPCDNLHVGVQRGRDPVGLVPGDAPSAAWTLELELRDTGDGRDVRGPEVQGRRGERFVYLTWGHVARDGSFTMVRRAKLVLDDVLAALDDAPHATTVVAEVGLADERGGPRCARLRPPALVLRAV